MQHGSSAYAGGCRCDTCRIEGTAYQTVMRKRRWAQGPPAGVHHGTSCYCNWGCRCEICVDANTKYQRKARERRRKAQQLHSE